MTGTGGANFESHDDFVLRIRPGSEGALCGRIGLRDHEKATLLDVGSPLALQQRSYIRFVPVFYGGVRGE
jgi:hypothetical protein